MPVPNGPHTVRTLYPYVAHAIINMTTASVSAHFIGLAANIQLIQICLYRYTEISFVATQLLLLCITDAGENDDNQ
jgi:hypothetical protein